VTKGMSSLCATHTLASSSYSAEILTIPGTL
jgi:hypothetical protein